MVDSFGKNNRKKKKKEWKKIYQYNMQIKLSLKE